MLPQQWLLLQQFSLESNTLIPINQRMGWIFTKQITNLASHFCKTLYCKHEFAQRQSAMKKTPNTLLESLILSLSTDNVKPLAARRSEPQAIEIVSRFP